MGPGTDAEEVAPASMSRRLASPDEQGRLPNLDVPGLLRRAATDAPGRAALVFLSSEQPEVRYTYRQLLARCERAADELRSELEPGERIALWAQNHCDWTVLQLGAAMAGIVLVPLNPSLTEHEARFVLNDSTTAGLFFDQRFRGEDRRRVITALQADVPSLRVAHPLDEWSRLLDQPADRRYEHSVGPSTVGMIQYTSGTTGSPKGAVLYHRGMSLGPTVLAEELDLGPAPVWVNAMPLFHVGGCGPFTTAPLAVAGTHVLLDRFEPGLLLRAITDERATLFGGVPAMLLDLLDRFDHRQHSVASVRAIMSGGTSVPPSLVRQIEEAFGARYVGSYGQTETHGNTTLTRPGDTAEDKATTVGRRLPHISVKIVDAEGSDVPVGTVGELCTDGPAMMKGYWGDSVSTSAAFDAEGWLRSGDLCSMDDRGYVTFAGRLKEMIVRGGENIYPREIEDVLSEDPDVTEIAVVGVPSERLGEEVAAFVYSAEGGCDLTRLCDLAVQRLAWYKQPRFFYAVSDLPRTASGKVAKYRLVAAWSRHDAGTREPGTSPTDAEWELAPALVNTLERP